MYRMQGGTSSPEVSARVSKSTYARKPREGERNTGSAKSSGSKRHVQGGNLSAKDPKQAKKSYRPEEPGRQGMIRQTQNLIAPFFFLMGWRHMQIFKMHTGA
jgi:hypothetical protein